jgi:hypothetical protein
MKGFIVRLFWSEERRERERPRRKHQEVWLHPALWLVTVICTFAAIGTQWIPARHAWVTVLLMVPWVVLFVALIANSIGVRRRRQEGWTPVRGVHTPPRVRLGESPLVVRWRWLTRRHPDSEEPTAP